MKKSGTLKLRAYRDVQWTDENDQALSTDTDSVIGKRFGISPRSIHARRHNLGIRILEHPTYRRTKAMDKLLGTMQDTELAKLKSLTPYEVRRRRKELGIAAFVLPDDPDHTLARKWRIPQGAVRCQRIGLYIGAR